MMGVSLHILVFALFSVSLAADISERRGMKSGFDDENPEGTIVKEQSEAKSGISRSRRGHNEWRTEILKGVDKVEMNDTLGRMMVHGADTEVILANSDLEPVIAAAELGEGRVLVLTKDTYLSPFLLEEAPETNQEIMKNMKNWITRGRDGICSLYKMSAFLEFDFMPVLSTDKCKALVWFYEVYEEDEDKSETFNTRLINYVKSGGGLVIGHRQSPILEEIGITYIKSSHKGDVYTIDDNMLKWAENSNILNMLEQIKVKPDKMEVYGAQLMRVTDDCSDRAFSTLNPLITKAIKIVCATTNCLPIAMVDKYIDTKLGVAAVSVMTKILLRTGEFDGNKVAPGMHIFPGNYVKPPPLTSATYTASVKGNLATSFPTGYHLPAGQEVVVSWSSAPSKNWQIMIDGHDDTLYHRESLLRYPVIQMIKNLETSPLKFSSPFGGNIYLTSPAKVTEEMTIKLENVVETPIFRVGEGDKWESEMRHRPGLWADFVGENITITMPSWAIRDLPDPTSVMKMWDEIVGVQNELSGHDPSLGRGEWMITDQQMSGGWFHAGYPIVLTVLESYKNKSEFLFNETVVRQGRWGVFHEIGHMMQYRSWTWGGMGEVTVNIFTLYTMEKITGIKPCEYPWLTSKFDQHQRYLEGGADYDHYYDTPVLPLLLYAQLARDLGWDTYKAVFKSYIGVSADNFPEDIDEIDEWIIRFSKKSGKSVVPAYDFWGFTIRDRVTEAVKGLPPYLPDDESTKEWASERAQKIRAKYNMDAK